MKDLGPAKRILGIDINRDRDNDILILSQEGYLKKILNLFGLGQAKYVNTPIGAHFKLFASRN